MTEHNIYKSIVTGVLICLLIFCSAGWLRNLAREQKTYGFILQSESDLTGDIVAEFKKLSGIRCFEPIQTIPVTIYLNQYSMDAKLAALDLDSSRLHWKDAEKNIPLGNTPALFFGADAFSSFSDRNGYAPEKSQIEAWIQNYPELELTITYEIPFDNYKKTGCTKKAKIYGIFEEPKDQICMDKQQIQNLFGHSVHTLSGYMEISGQQNAKKAQKLLEEAGFVIIKDTGSPSF